LFDKLVDVLLEFASLFKPFTVVNPCNRAIIVRSLPWCKQKIREVGPGFHWHLPLRLEEAYYLSLATRVEELAAQTLVTKDGRNVAAGVVVTFRVHDIEKAINAVFEPFAAVHDAVQANFAEAVLNTDYADITKPEFADRLTAVCRKKGFTYGFEIDSVRLAEFAPVRTFRLMGDGAL
jgi:regulator of protease activity HflC (stomatin/prohibitin superfamily)